MIDLDEFTRAYIEAVYFTDTSEPGQPAADAELSADALACIRRDCERFQRDHAEKLAETYGRDGYTAVCAGHDFWLTRNHHGAGFWGRPELRGEGLDGRLTDAAQAFGEIGAYAGDSGHLELE